MTRDYREEDLLSLSGIQHFAFCERQWGLIHVENQWVDNVRTVEGKILHQRADDPYFTETRGDIKTIRSVSLMSQTLGLYGVADVIELQKLPEANAGVRYSIVEYKRGKPKPDDRDEVQLCAQAICLEEMLKIVLEYGYLYYGETKRRRMIAFDGPLRSRVKELAKKMHELFAQGITPPPVKDKRCKNCSMTGICVPELAEGNKKAKKYLSSVFEEMMKD